MIAAFRRWWASRSTVTITFPIGQHGLVVTGSGPGEYAITIDGRRVVVRARWWHTRAAVARRIRRALAREGWRA